jgi:polysaccharide export outer membrane protein
LIVALAVALAASACARRPAQQQYMLIDPQTGQPIAMMAQPAPQPQAMAQAAPRAAPQPRERGLFNQAPRRPYVGGPYVAPYGNAAPYGYASAPAAPAYALDAGDRLRIVVFGQDGISNTYIVDAGGNVTLPLVGTIPARGIGTHQLAQMISERLRQGYVREPHVTVEVEGYRPFFILGEVTNPGQYPYSPNMTVETAVAIAGGFAPRASKGSVKLTRNAPGQQMRGDVPLSFPLRPGDTIVVGERWF